MQVQPHPPVCALRDLDMPGRDPRFPPVKLIDSHPLVKADDVNRIFVLVMDTTDAGVLAAKFFEDELSLPQGTPDHWTNGLGLLGLQPGDFVILRSKGCEDPYKDAVAVLTTDEQHQASDDVRDFADAAEEVLGTPELLASGTTAFEQTGNTIPAKGGVRAFAVGTTVERVSLISAPAAAGKGVGGGLKEYHHMVRKLVSATGRMVVKAFQRLPEQYRKAIEGNSSAINLPVVGAEGNVLASNIQLNIASVEAGGGAEEGLVGDLGARYGEAHADHRDHPGYFSVMLCYPSYPASYDPGYFHILHLGVFAPTNRHSAILFSGQRRHACTPAIVPAGAIPDPTAARLHVVYYPRESAVTGSVRHTIGSIPQPADTLSVTSEMIGINNSGHVPQVTNRSTFINDGPILMPRAQHVNFVGRSLLQLFCYGLQQMDPAYRINMDASEILRHITFEDEDGRRVSLQSWNEVPDVTGVPAFRLEAAKAFREHCEHVSRFIPQVAAKTIDPSNVETTREDPRTTPKTSRKQPARRGASDGEAQEELEGNMIIVKPRRRVPAQDRPEADQTRVQRKAKKAPNLTTNQSTGTPTSKSASTNKPGLGGGKRRRGEGEDNQEELGGDRAAKKKQDLSTGARKVQKKSGQTHASEWRSVNHQKGQDPIATRTRGSSSHCVNPAMSNTAEISVTENLGSAPSRNRPSPAMSNTEQISVTEILGAAPSRNRPSEPAERTLYPFLLALTLSNIKLEKASLEADYAAWMTATMANKRKHVMSSTRSCAILERSPLSSSAPAQARSLSAEVKVLEEIVGASNFTKRFEQRDVMLWSTLVWRWCDITVATEVERRTRERRGWLRDTGECTDWIDELTSQVVEMLVQKKKEWKFDPATRPLLRAVGSDPYRHTNSLSRRTFVRSEPSFPKTVADAVRDILPRWLGIFNSTAHDHRIRAWFVEAVVSKLGHQVLTTRIMWNAFTTFKSRHYVKGFAIYHTSTPDLSLFNPFLEELASHSILDRQSHIGKAYWESMPYTQNPQYDLMPGGDLGHARDFIEYVIQGIEKATGRLPAAEAGGTQTADCAIRELASDRQHYAGSQGPYVLPFLQTDSGLFSAVVLVGILYHSAYSKTGRLRFKDPEDMATAIAEYNRSWGQEEVEDSGLLRLVECGLAVEPTLDSVEEYWERCQVSGWVELSQRNPTFVECLGFLLRLPDGKRRFSHLTVYGAYSLACDMAYAGICQAPIVQDVALMMSMTVSPSFEALVRLGLIDHTAGPNSSQVQDVLEYLLGQLNRDNRVKEWNEDGVDVITLEHALKSFIRVHEPGLEMESHDM